MGSSGPDWSEIHSKRPGGPLVPFLGFFSILYGLGVRLRLLSYRLGLLKRRSLPGFVLSVGNITAGGTGKTPAVLMLARWASKEGFRAAVLSRGYGGSFREDVLAVSDGERVLSTRTRQETNPVFLLQG